MTTTNLLLRLDSRALEALFPEGTQARMDLQQAVIAEFVRKHIKPSALGADIQTMIERARGDALQAIKLAKERVADKAVEEQGLKSDWGRIQVQGSAKDAIVAAARSAVQAEIHKAVQEHVAAASEALRGTVAHDAQAAVNRMLNAEIRDAVKARVAAVAAELLK